MQVAQDEASYAQLMASQRTLQFAGIADRASVVTGRFPGRAPTLPNAMSDGGYLVFF